MAERGETLAGVSELPEHRSEPPTVTVAWILDPRSGRLRPSGIGRRELDLPEEADLTDLLDRLDASDRHGLELALRACARGGPPVDRHVVARCQTRARRRLRVHAWSVTDPQDRSLRLIGMIIDRGAAAARSDHEAPLPASDRVTVPPSTQLTMPLESVIDGFFTLDHDWRITWLNAKAEELVRLDGRALVGRAVWEAFPTAVGTSLHRAHLLAARTGTQQVAVSYYASTERWLEATIDPVADGLEVTLRDVTARIARDRLFGRVLEAERSAMARADGHQRLKDGLVEAISHQLRTPLTVLQGLVSSLHRLGDDVDPETRERIERSLVDQAGNLATLLQEFLDVGDLADGGTVPRVDRFDATAAVRDAIDQHPIAARCQLTSSLTQEVRGDRQQLVRIVDHLLDNSERYAGETNVEVCLTPLSSGGVRLEVRDHGPGIPSGELDRVFEPFHRLADGHPQPGTGVGLALVTAFARRHGGSAWATDTQGQGGHIVVELPDPTWLLQDRR